MLDSVGGPPRGMFDGCRTQTEVIVAVHAMLGLAAVEQLVREGGLPRETLLEAADEVRSIGLVALADVLKRVARRARSRPPRARERHQARMARKRQRLT
jgi:hypothetical protein